MLSWPPDGGAAAVSGAGPDAQAAEQQQRKGKKGKDSWSPMVRLTCVKRSAVGVPLAGRRCCREQLYCSGACNRKSGGGESRTPCIHGRVPRPCATQPLALHDTTPCNAPYTSPACPRLPQRPSPAPQPRAFPALPPPPHPIATPLLCRQIGKLHQAVKVNNLPVAMATFREILAAGGSVPVSVMNSLLFLACGCEQWERYARGLPPLPPTALPVDARDQDPPAAAAAAGAAAAAAAAEVEDGGKKSKEQQGQGQGQGHQGKRRNVNAVPPPEGPPPSKEELLAAVEELWAAMTAAGQKPDAGTYLGLARREALRGEPAAALAWVSGSGSGWRGWEWEWEGAGGVGCGCRVAAECLGELVG